MSTVVDHADGVCLGIRNDCYEKERKDDDDDVE